MFVPMYCITDIYVGVPRTPLLLGALLIIHKYYFFRKHNCIISNRFDSIIWQLWFKQEIKQRLHLYMGIVQKEQIAP